MFFYKSEKKVNTKLPIMVYFC